MAKRSVDKSDSEWVEPVDEDVENDYEPVVLEAELPEPVTVAMRLLKNVTLKIVGSVSGNLYIFNGGGSIVDVDERDVPGFLARTSGRPCCASEASKYFEIAY